MWSLHWDESVLCPHTQPSLKLSSAWLWAMKAGHWTKARGWHEKLIDDFMALHLMLGNGSHGSTDFLKSEITMSPQHWQKYLELNGFKWNPAALLKSFQSSQWKAASVPQPLPHRPLNLARVSRVSSMEHQSLGWMETGTTHRSSWASRCWVSQRSAPKLRPERERMGCEKVAATAVISGKHGTISNLLVLYTSRFIFSYNVSAQRRYLPHKSHWLRSSIHEILFQELSCTSVNAWKSMSFSQWPFRHRDHFKMAWKDNVQLFQYNTQNFQYHFNDCLLQNRRKSPNSIFCEGSSQSWKNREAGLIYKKVVDCQF